ncbi:hypothetical protein BDW74DRAFT_101386 [Aspergillus multicolor]|uniref:uncharacterized protein n=1 Tax=Aspergillus multicolor TaxID=41759 RepID=UPI003CCD1498
MDASVLLSSYRLSLLAPVHSSSMDLERPVESIFGDQPPGIDLTESNVAMNNGVAATLTVVATLVVALRLYTRIKIQKLPCEADDWLVAVALIPAYGSLACTIIGANYGIGRHVWTPAFATAEDIIHGRQVLFAYGLVYLLSMPPIKLSMLFFYRRIFGSSAPLTLYFCGFLTLAHYIGCTVAYLSCCRPPSFFWTSFQDPTSGRCTCAMDALQLASEATNMLTDVLILTVPIPPVLRLQMRTAQKVLVLGIFLVGAFVCIASAMRLYYIILLETDRDETWLMGHVFVWSVAQPCVGITCACLPTLHPLLRRTLQALNLKIRGLFSTFPSGSASASAAPGMGSSPNATRGSQGKGKRRAGTVTILNEDSGALSPRTRRFRPGPEGDEVLLTSTTTIELEGMSRRWSLSGSESGLDSEGNTTRGTNGSSCTGTGGSVDVHDRARTRTNAMGIQVKTDFRWSEERGDPFRK